MRVLASRTTLALFWALSLGLLVSACATGKGEPVEDMGVTGDTGPGDTGPEDAGMPQICESCRDTSNCPMDFECQTIDDATGQRACLPTCGRDEFDSCPEGWACVGPSGAGVCFPARGCCTAQNTGVACEGEGECGAGVIECDDDGGARCSTEPGGSADESVAETCNGLDDDCDGEVDETFLVGDPCDGRGACGAGTVQCDPRDDTDMSTVCSTEPGGTQNQAAPNDLLCNGIDDDCDGQTDEDRGVGMVCDGAGACGEGQLECATINTTRCSTDPGGSAHNPGGMDICDGADNDCDTFVDETFPTIGNVCAGIGACGAGLVECATTATTRCSTHPGGSQFTGAANDGTCNGMDDDCDGDVDEDLGIGQPCDPPGQCGAGVFECNGAMMPVCNTGPGGTQSQAQTEVCNGQNDDCDGATDEGFNLGTACDGPGECGAGVFECNGSGGARCSTGPSGSQSEVEAETCNGLDDDCNGTADNGAANVLCPATSNVSVTACSGASGCSISNCSSNFHNPDLSYNTGCECNDTESGSDASCSVGTFDLDLAVNGMGTLNGIIIGGSDSDWYQVRAAAGQTSGFEVTFGSNPGNALRFEIDEQGCGANPACGPGNDLTRITRNNCSGNIRPNFPSQGITFGCGGGQVDGAYTYYIRVYRAVGSTTCIPYSLTVRAAATNM